ncbi:hypothetical protein M2M39_14170 [Enterococcus faecalis]|nr:hypothetical protein [Enterococcus faecalis]MDK4416547.1 hypothetical protein [Enterococcus faecalis]
MIQQLSRASNKQRIQAMNQLKKVIPLSKRTIAS